MSDERIDTSKYDGHTEGPWAIRTSKVAGATRMMSFFIRRYTNTENGISKLICSMEGIHEHNADAELIADAPEMLAELKRCYEKIDKMDEAILIARELLMSYYDAVTLSDDEAAQEILDVVKELRKASE